MPDASLSPPCRREADLDYVILYIMRTYVPQYLEKRFGRVTRVATSLAFSVQMILYMAIVLYVPALTLEAVTGLPRATSIVLVGFVCVFYSTIGGIKAVIFTDLFQVIAEKWFVIAAAVLKHFRPLEIKLNDENKSQECQF